MWQGAGAGIFFFYVILVEGLMSMITCVNSV